MNKLDDQYPGEYYSEGQETFADRRNPVKETIKSIPRNYLVWLLVIGALAIYLMEDLPSMNKVLAIGGGIFFLTILSGYQEKDENTYIQEEEAKSIVYKALEKKKEGKTLEFDGLKGTVSLTGFCNLQPWDGKKHLWWVGWKHIDENNETHHYVATVDPHKGNIDGFHDIPTRFRGTEQPQIKTFIPFNIRQDRAWRQESK